MLKKLISTLIVVMVIQGIHGQSDTLKILNFSGDKGFKHDSKEAAQNLIEILGVENSWQVVSTDSSEIFNLKDLLSFDVVVFNNNCGTDGRILSKDQQLAFQNYIRNGGGFVAIHCAGAIWHEEGQFQEWYERLVGARMVDHPPVQRAILIVDDTLNPIVKHLKPMWAVTDEWHRYDRNPRENVRVLVSLDEESYQGSEKMGGDHPFIWYHYFDGGRSFFISLGHTKEIYADQDYQKLVKKAILWAADKYGEDSQLITDGLMLDLDADFGVEIEDGNRILQWRNNKRGNDIGVFEKQDKGRKTIGSGRPRLQTNVPKLNGHNAVVFHRQELVNKNEDSFDHLITGTGYTWFSVMAVYDQVVGLPEVNSFFGNLRNSNEDNQGNYEGLWAGLTDDNHMWTGGRNGVTFGRWDANNIQLMAIEPLKKNRYYVVAGRMAGGTGKVKSELFINSVTPVAEGVFPVNENANPSKMVIGQERDATNHPGNESFDGEIARFLIYDRNLSDDEMTKVFDHLLRKYGIEEPY